MPTRPSRVASTHLDCLTWREPIRLVEHHKVQREHVVGEAELASVRYTALSYCWRDKYQALQQPLTTRENIQDRYVGIPDPQLSSVLRDAVWQHGSSQFGTSG